MDSIEINGGTPLKGDIYVSGAKNAVLPIIMASILSDSTIYLSNIPDLTDVHTTILLIESLGGKVSKGQGKAESKAGMLAKHLPFNSHEEQGLKAASYDYSINNFLVIDASHLTNYRADYEIVRRMRASIWALAPLLAKYGQAEVSLPGAALLVLAKWICTLMYLKKWELILKYRKAI